MNRSMNIEGPMSPTDVMRRLTDKTVQFPLINESARCPAT